MLSAHDDVDTKSCNIDFTSCLNFWDKLATAVAARGQHCMWRQYLTYDGSMKPTDDRGPQGWFYWYLQLDPSTMWVMSCCRSRKFWTVILKWNMNTLTPEEGRRTYQPKHCGNNNKDEDNSPKTLNDKNCLYSLFLWLYSLQRSKIAASQTGYLE